MKNRRLYAKNLEQEVTGRFRVTYRNVREGIPSGTFKEMFFLCLMAIALSQPLTHTHTQAGPWDLLIAHPPCTYLSNVCTRGFSLRCTEAEKVVKRWEERAKGAIFFMYFALADCQRICVENPVGFMNNNYRKPDQIIDPYMFAESTEDRENYVTKKTCLWLKGLPTLQTNGLPKPDNAALFGRYASGKAKNWEDSFSRDSKVRSKTFPGIAKAMAEQWGGLEKE